MSDRQWVDCPHCHNGYYHMWEYGWDNQTRCIHCKKIWECVLEPEKLEDDVIKEEEKPNYKDMTLDEFTDLHMENPELLDDEEYVKEGTRRFAEADRGRRIKEAHRLNGLLTEELVREVMIKELLE